MGKYLNPGNGGFSEILKTDYVDKTGMIGLINSTIGTKTKLTCISRPRRFGKSYATQMLCAYYDGECDSSSLFEGRKISTDPHYKEYLNKYNVLYLDITGFISNLKRKKLPLNEVVSIITDEIKKELVEAMPELSELKEVTDCIRTYADRTGKQFVFILDEWDAIIREGKKDNSTQEAYLNLLREWFKNGNFTPYVVAAAYMTGILPIKKDGTESAISDFMEYTVLNPAIFAEYTGFTNEEVKELCEGLGGQYSTMKEWYDGYSFTKESSVYNPYSVMMALRMGNYESFWQKTSAAESLSTYIDMNYEGLQDDILRLIAGEQLEVNLNGYENDMESFKNKDDVLTLLIHLGYLAYDLREKTVRIPNKEVCEEFKELLRNGGKTKLCDLVRLSDKLLEDTLAGNESEVCRRIEAVRESSYAPTFYNDEQALRYVVKFAYISCVDRYLRIEELPSGKGIADVVFLPKKKTALPAMVVELKWDKTKEAAIKQILDRNYPEAIRDYIGEVVLVGISYDEKKKSHSCRIERMDKT